MNSLKNLLLFLFLTCLSISSFAQQNELLTSIPSSKEDFIKSEPAVINTINWLESTPVTQELEKRKLLNSNLIVWITNSPTVTIELNSKVVTFTKKNSELLITFMGGWIKYALQNSYSQDAVKCNLAGIRSAIKVYQMGNGLKRDKQIEKVIELDSKNELEKWLTEQLGKK